jgi:hypothetical protein
MFVETVTAPRAAADAMREKLQVSQNPPDALVLAVEWVSGEGEVTRLHVWDNPGAIADFYLERIQPIIEAEGKPPGSPERHGEPIEVYVRGG